jgi:2-methylcitrate dehydratase PrpD
MPAGSDQITTTLADFAAGLSVADVPPAVAERVGWILADCVGCIVAGNRQPAVRRFAALRGASAGGASSLFGTSLGAAPADAAMVNGMAGTWYDLDEGNLHTKGHAGIQIVPALLAEAQLRRLPGQAVLLALAAGYEVGCRVYGATSARLAVHPHGTFGPLAAAVALARLRALPAPRMARLIAIAAGLALASSRATLAQGATVRNAFTATSGGSAFLALELEEAGIVGEADPFTSVFGAILGTGFDPALCVDGMGAEWRLLRNYFKQHASVRYAHSALDLVDDLRAAHGPIAPARIVTVGIETYAMAAMLAGCDVATPFGTRFSIPFLVAARLLVAEEPIDGDGGTVFARADVHALARRVQVRENPLYTMHYPERQPSSMVILLDDGRRLHADAQHMRGEAERPHGAAAMTAKFMALTAPSWGDHAAVALAGLLDAAAMPDFAAWAIAARHAAAAAP